MYTKTVQAMINKDMALEAHHKINLCSQCNNAVWSTTKYSTFYNSKPINDFLKFLTSDAVKKSNASSIYRCFCKILHEYQDFTWYDRCEKLHIINNCDEFIEYSDSIDDGNSSYKQKKHDPLH